ncbi:MAG: hypothetical protein WC260_01645 [Candidatus Pacearchaeota archaeon]
MENKKQFYGHDYESPKEESGILDKNTGEVIDTKNLSPFDVIKTVAEQTGVEIRDPRKSCKSCYGRGYIGRDSFTKQPIPCTCINIPKTTNEKESENFTWRQMNYGNKLNRQQRRREEKYRKKLYKKLLNNKSIREQLLKNMENESEDVENIVDVKEN